MKVKYSLNPKFIGCVHQDYAGRTVLTADLSQTKLKKLHQKGNEFVLVEVESIEIPSKIKYKKDSNVGRSNK